MVDRIGNCRILGEIGSGGMAVVYKAVQEPLGRLVAIKALKPSIAVDSGFAKRFEREAHFMASLQHENILHVYDFIKERGTMYIVMEYVQGIDLYDLLEITPRLPVEVASIIALQVARALDYAHFRGIIHRDIKPANVMISHHGEVKLMDFGIARDDKLSDLTETGTGLGTPSYMSPEQILGDKLDFRSDIFSVGIVLYQMVTGRKPFVEDDARTVMQKIRLDRYTSPRKINTTVPRALERIMARCMEKMPANRYPTTQALIDDLQDFLASRVPINHNARLVMYLREVGTISDEQADEILAASAPNRVRRSASDRTLLVHNWMVQGALFAAILGGGGAIQAFSGRLAGDPDQFAAESGAPVVPQRAGYLRFVVDPWAEVYIDGQHVLTTPSAQRIALAPGRHFLRLHNPYFRGIDREVWVEEGEVQLIDETLVEEEPGHATTPAPLDPGAVPAVGADGATALPSASTTGGGPG
ncbi:serine/threonine protein kinase [Sandaracinus amylolyticus]|uniref:non-specific serine/threonine protein kinase n=1 Tax=Sandaracinus amylolyticus TaxID=927083 RepID=A0A0F6YGM4_9BACT|nr:serine/threonine-protein kinase [Sandaracinus amylolyticus]AKF04876.1 Serine/threonine protein kinase PrkC, regulator of stationary phase [Sandaracinus amylolyticus]